MVVMRLSDVVGRLAGAEALANTEAVAARLAGREVEGPDCAKAIAAAAVSAAAINVLRIEAFLEMEHSF
jgi:hypothetical protein